MNPRTRIELAGSRNNSCKSVQIVQQVRLQVDRSVDSHERKLFLSQLLLSFASSSARMQLINRQIESVRNECEIVQHCEFTELETKVLVFFTNNRAMCVL